MINDSSASEKPVSPVSNTAGERNIDFWTHEMLCGLVNFAWTMKKSFQDLQPHQAGDVLHDFITTIQHEDEVEREP